MAQPEGVGASYWQPRQILSHEEEVTIVDAVIRVPRLFRFYYGATHVHAEDSRAAVFQAISHFAELLSCAKADLDQMPPGARRCSCVSRTVR